MKKSFLSFVWFVSLTLSMGVNAKDVVGVEKQVEELRQENTRLKSEFELLTQKVTQESNITDKSFTGISNQLSAASTAATWFSIVLTIVSIALGALIAWLSNKTQKAAQEAVAALKETQRLKTDIDDNLRDLNLRLIDDETTHLLERLQKYPQDIGNMHNMLALRKLNTAHITMLKTAYKKLTTQLATPEHCNNTQYFFVLVAQHAPAVLLADLTWRELFNREIRTEHIICCFYDDELRDFVKKCIKPAISQNDFSDYQKDVSDFLCALLESMPCKTHGAHLNSVRVGVYTDLINFLNDKGYMDKATPEFLDKNKAWQEAQL